MRYEETGLRITEDAVLAHNAAGEVLNTYRRPRQSTLFTLKSMGDITEDMYVAGIRYNRLYEASGRAPRPAAGDPTKPKVDGAGRPPDEIGGSDSAKRTLDALREETLGEKGAAMLDDICGRDMTMTDYRELAHKRWQSCIRELTMYLDRLDRWFRKN